MATRQRNRKKVAGNHQNRNRKAVIMVRMFPAEKDQLTRYALSHGRMVSTWIRELALDHVRGAA